MKVLELMRKLARCEPDDEVLLAADPECNAVCPVLAVESWEVDKEGCMPIGSPRKLVPGKATVIIPAKLPAYCWED